MSILKRDQQVERHEYERLLVLGLLLLKQQPERARGPWPWRTHPHMMTSSSHYLNIKGRHGGFHVRAGEDILPRIELVEMLVDHSLIQLCRNDIHCSAVVLCDKLALANLFARTFKAGV